MRQNACERRGAPQSSAWVAGLVIAGLILVGITPVLADEAKPGDVESRGFRQMERPTPESNPGQAGPPGQPNAQLPTFPQKFEVQGPEFTSFGFAVTQPGLVVLTAQIQGAPVIVTLQGPAPQPIAQQGTGQVQLTYMVTPQDVQKSLFWRAQLKLAQPAPAAQGGRASGIVNLQYPTVNPEALQQAVHAMAGQQRQPTALEQQQMAAQAAAQMDAAFQQHKTQFDRQQMDRRAALQSQIQPQLDQLRNRMSGQIRPRGLEGTEGISGEAGTIQKGEIGTRALRGDQMTAMQQPLDVARMPKTAVPSPPPTASSSQALQSAGSGPGPQTVMPNPAISSISVTQGQPGDPVMITGGGFGNNGGEVHFVIAPGKDVLAPAGTIWSDNQIFVSVPDATGVLGFNGTMYIKRAPDMMSSNLVPFRFNPLSELRHIARVTDATLQQFNGVSLLNMGSYVRRLHSYPFWGPKGNDYIFQNTRLKNGWIVKQLPLISLPYSGATDGGAYLVESHVNTDWPYINVGFWVNDGSSNWFKGGSSPMLDYSISIVIQGPKGVPDGVVVP